MIPVTNTVFTPASRSVGDAQSLKTGTTTVAITCKDCVILAADRRATAGNLIANKKTQKVLQVTDHIAVTVSGSVSDLQLLYRYLSVELKLKEIRDGRQCTVREAASLLATWVYNLIRSSYGVTHFLVGGYDVSPRLYDVYPDGSSMEAHDEYLASGSGSVFALGVLENKYKQGLSQEDGVKLAIEAINAALARDSASGNGVDVYAIGMDGCKKVFEKALEYKL